MASEIRFHLDECVPRAVGEGLRRRGIDVTLATEGDIRGAADESVLDLATRRQRVLITQDADFLRLHQERRTHAGVVYYAPGSRTVGELISRLVLLHGVLASEEMQRHVEFL